MNRSERIMLKKIFIIILVCFIYSANNDNILTAKINQGAETNHMVIDIYCHNINDIAGVQFELPNYINLLNVEEVSTKDIEFEFHHSNKGLILGFSMTGDKIGSFNSSQWDEFTNNQNVICRLHVSIGANYQWETTDGSYIMCPIKTILASPRGERLSFTNYQDKNRGFGFQKQLKNLNTSIKSVKVSFYE